MKRGNEGMRSPGLILLMGGLSLGFAGCATSGAASSVPAKPVTTKAHTAAPGPAAAAHAAGAVAKLPDPTAQEIEAGIQVTHIGVTASGGLVDARFRVLDPAKANTLLGNMANAPALIAGDLPPLMAPHHAIKSGRYAKDQVFVVLYPNMRQAVRSGAPVSVAFGPVRIGPVTAQ
jgi:hypothetical protein